MIRSVSHLRSHTRSNALLTNGPMYVLTRRDCPGKSLSRKRDPYWANRIAWKFLTILSAARIRRQLLSEHQSPVFLCSEHAVPFNFVTFSKVQRRQDRLAVTSAGERERERNRGQKKTKWKILRFNSTYNIQRIIKTPVFSLYVSWGRKNTLQVTIQVFGDAVLCHWRKQAQTFRRIVMTLSSG